MPSNEKKVALATNMIEHAVELAIEAGRHLTNGDFESALSSAGACVAQIFAFEAMRQKTNGAAVVHQWNQLWTQAVEKHQARGKLYRAATHRSRN
jgi:hypothetical protein